MVSRQHYMANESWCWWHGGGEANKLRSTESCNWPSHCPLVVGAEWCHYAILCADWCCCCRHWAPVIVTDEILCEGLTISMSVIVKLESKEEFIMTSWCYHITEYRILAEYSTPEQTIAAPSSHCSNATANMAPTSMHWSQNRFNTIHKAHTGPIFYDD